MMSKNHNEQNNLLLDILNQEHHQQDRKASLSIELEHPMQITPTKQKLSTEHTQKLPTLTFDKVTPVKNYLHRIVLVILCTVVLIFLNTYSFITMDQQFQQKIRNYYDNPFFKAAVIINNKPKNVNR